MSDWNSFADWIRRGIRTRQEMIDDLLDLLVSKLLLQVLYLYSDKAGNNFQAIAYSMPYQDEMYVVRIASHQCGIIDEIHVDFYASIETVFTFLKQELERLEQPQPDLDIEVPFNWWPMFSPSA